ncbi:MAG: glycosyltransferase family 4 protein [Bacteriovoracia bacterium]
MKVLIVHVPYEHHGGEDVHVDALMQGYRRIGISPILFPENRNPPKPYLKKALQSLEPSSSFKELDELMEAHQPKYLHIHNIFPVLGPKFLRWTIQKKIPVVMTVHNHRFFCTNGLALRSKKICKDCFNSKIAWRPILHNCNGSWQKSVYHSLALTEIRLQDLYANAIDRFVAPSPYLQAELVRLGIPKEKVLHILNPVFWFTSGSQPSGALKYDVLYAGRLSHEKGIRELLAATELLPDIRFVVAGDGPERPEVEKRTQASKNITFLGPVSHDEVLDLIIQSKIAVLPSICNETLSTFALEVFFQGKHCVVPALDSTSWLASGDFPGVLSKPGDPKDLARVIRNTLALPPIDEKQKTNLQKKLGFERFCSDLVSLVSGMKISEIPTKHDNEKLSPQQSL